MLSQQQAMASGLPESVKVKAQKGFRSLADGQFGIVNPGDVVMVPREVAMELRAAQKAYMTDEPLRRDTSYLPERKKNPPPNAPAQITALSAQVAALTQQVASLTAARKGEVK